MPKAMTILLIGLLVVVALGTIAAIAAPVLWFSITAPLWSERSQSQPTEIVVPQPASIVSDGRCTLAGMLTAGKRL